MTATDPRDLADRAVVELARQLPLAASEAEMVELLLALVAPVLPQRALAVRVADLRGREPARIYVRHGTLRDGVDRERFVLSATSLARARVKGAVTASARLHVGDRWDSPFVGVGGGFAVPLVAAGELYGMIDIGYTPGVEIPADDVALIESLGGIVAVALRGQRLHADTVELRDYQARLIEHASALIVGIDRSWRITVANRALLELTGYSREEVLGHDLRDFLPRDQRAHLTARFRSALEGEHQVALDIALLSRGGARVRTLWTVAAIGRDTADQRASGPIEAVVAIGTDQSRLQELEDQVIRAERLATLGKIAAGVVHELNNPLTSISVYADYLQRKLVDAGIDPTDLEKLRRISASAQRIQRFARELVDYARPPGTDIEPIDINDVVRQSLSICEHLFDTETTRVAMELDPTIPMVEAVPGQLEQVVINLVTNAAHAVDVAGGTIRVRTRHGHGRIELEIADSGPGVPEADRERIFEPFYTTKPDGKGTGLGLPIVRNIVDQHLGEVAVGDADLGGAAFVVRLPAAIP